MAINSACTTHIASCKQMRRYNESSVFFFFPGALDGEMSDLALAAPNASVLPAPPARAPPTGLRCQRTHTASAAGAQEARRSHMFHTGHIEMSFIDVLFICRLTCQPSPCWNTHLITLFWGAGPWHGIQNVFSSTTKQPKTNSPLIDGLKASEVVFP